LRNAEDVSIYSFTRNTWTTDLDLCNHYHITQKELVEKIGVSASQLSRIVKGTPEHCCKCMV